MRELPRNLVKRVAGGRRAGPLAVVFGRAPTVRGLKIRTLHHPGPTGKINVTPLIDVVMVLIVFYLIVGKMASDRRAPVDLPSSRVGTSEEGGRKSLVITVQAGHDSGGSGGVRVLVDGVEVQSAKLKGVLAARGVGGGGSGGGIVQLRADKGLPYGMISPVLEACRGAGVASVKLITDRVPPSAAAGGDK